MRKILTFILISLVAGCASTTKETTKVEVADEYSGPEKLNFVVPKGWGVAHQAQNDSGAILELISNNESLESWSRMVTIQTFKNPEQYEPEKFILSMAELAKKQCANVEIHEVRNDFQNGHPFSQKVISCIGKNGTKSKETMNIKAIKGKDSFYVAQVSYKVGIDKKEAYYWAIYLRDVVATKS